MKIIINDENLGKILGDYYTRKGYKASNAVIKLKEDKDGCVVFSHIEVVVEDKN